MRRICGVPLQKILYLDILVCSIGLIYVILKVIVVHNVGGYFSTPAYLVYRITAPTSTIIALISHIFLRRGIREQSKVYFQIHFAIRLFAKLMFYSAFLWFFFSAYLPNKLVSPYHKAVQTFVHGVVFGMGCFHLLVVKISMTEVLRESGDSGGGNADYIEQMDLMRSVSGPGQKFLKSITLSEKKVKIDLTKILGSGQFSKVVGGEYSGKSVAIKVTQKDNYPDFANNILSELKLLSLASHPHVVKLYGATFLHIYCGIVLEYCNHGSLESYLVKLDQSVGDKRTIRNEHELRRLSSEIALGMEYLASKHIVHGDLATRNVLLDENKSVKITDFGLSLKLYYYQLYATSGHSIFPWRRMPPEALIDLKFSVQSDVWSFGVLLWEIFSLGKIPYVNVNWSSNFAQLLKGGLRLGQPEFCDKQLYDLMKSCWHLETSQRIHFKEIRVQLEQMRSLGE